MHQVSLGPCDDATCARLFEVWQEINCTPCEVCPRWHADNTQAFDNFAMDMSWFIPRGDARMVKLRMADWWSPTNARFLISDSTWLYP